MDAWTMLFHPKPSNPAVLSSKSIRFAYKNILVSIKMCINGHFRCWSRPVSPKDTFWFLELFFWCTHISMCDPLPYAISLMRNLWKLVKCTEVVSNHHSNAPVQSCKIPTALWVGERCLRSIPLWNLFHILLGDIRLLKTYSGKRHEYLLCYFIPTIRMNAHQFPHLSFSTVR